MEYDLHSISDNFFFPLEAKLKVFKHGDLCSLANQASLTRRSRKVYNIHDSYNEPCQRMFNAIQPDSYIRPHMHDLDMKDELLIAVRGSFILLTFDDTGAFKARIPFDCYEDSAGSALGVEIDALTWHTVISCEPNSILLEVKAGPFDPNLAKRLAPWAPAEGCPQSSSYFEELRTFATCPSEET